MTRSNSNTIWLCKWIIRRAYDKGQHIKWRGLSRKLELIQEYAINNGMRDVQIDMNEAEKEYGYYKSSIIPTLSYQEREAEIKSEIDSNYLKAALGVDKATSSDDIKAMCYQIGRRCNYRRWSSTRVPNRV